MKLMRSRFRLLALLMACVFFLAAVFCAARLLKDSGISLSSVPSSLTDVIRTVLPAVSSAPPDGGQTLAPSDPASPETPAPGDVISPDPVYNVFGL